MTRASLVGLFEEAVALARDDTLGEAEKGRRLVTLLGLPVAEQRKLRLEHLYGPKMADDLLWAEAKFDRDYGARSRLPGDPAPTRAEVFPA